MKHQGSGSAAGMTVDWDAGPGNRNRFPANSLPEQKKENDTQSV